jgi:hypothetical protein
MQPSRHTPPQPAREDISPDELEAFDRVVARQANYGYPELRKLHPPEHRLESGDHDAATGQVQPYMGAMLNSPLIMNLISELGVVLRTRGERDDSYSHADREWVDMVLGEELHAWGVYYGHMWDAVAQGVRPEAIKALREGRDEDLSREELQLTRYIRQVVRGTVTSEAYLAIEERFGRRGAVEFTAFIGFLLMTLRLIQAFGAQPRPQQHVDELIEMMIQGTVEIPDPKARVPQLELDAV